MVSVRCKAPEVAERAVGIIQEHHPDLDAPDIRIEYIFVDPPPLSKGKYVAGKCRVVTGLNAFLACECEEPTADPFFVIEIARQVWDIIPPEQQTALLDHELCHASVIRDEEEVPKLSIRSHDVEEFSEIVGRHGLWDEGLQEFVKSALEGQDKG